MYTCPAFEFRRKKCRGKGLPKLKSKVFNIKLSICKIWVDVNALSVM